MRTSSILYAWTGGRHSPAGRGPTLCREDSEQHCYHLPAFTTSELGKLGAGEALCQTSVILCQWALVSGRLVQEAEGSDDASVRCGCTACTACSSSL